MTEDSGSRREQIQAALISRGIFAFEPELAGAAAGKFDHLGIGEADVALILDFARASGKRRMEKVLQDLDRNASYHTALTAARAWKDEQSAKRDQSESRPGEWQPRLRQRNPKALTHDERLQLIRETAQEFHDDAGGLQRFARFIGAASIDEANALLAEADAELSYRG